MEKKKYLYIDKEAIATLAMAKEGLLYPVEGLMTEKEAIEVDTTGRYNGKLFPFSFILAPSGRRNEEILKNVKKGETLHLFYKDREYGTLVVNEAFRIDKDERVRRIYGTNNPDHPGVQDTYRRLGNYAVCGEFEVDFEDIKDHKENIKKAIVETEATKISSLVMTARPFHRVHEKIIRRTLVDCDLLILFIQKPFVNDIISFDTKIKTIDYFVDNFLPKSRVVVIPLENTYIFGGFNELTLNSIVAKNYGSDKLILGQNHAGLGAYYESHRLGSVVDTLGEIDIEIDILGETVYCDQCKTLVNINTCPHGAHHHVTYNNDAIMELFTIGMLPPAILVRPEISSIILSEMFPDRLPKLRKIHQHIATSSGIIEDFQFEDFYKNMMELYQTSSLT